MFQKVSVKEIENIRERLESESEDKNLPAQRREEIESLIHHLNTWLCWKEYQEREHYVQIIKSES